MSHDHGRASVMREIMRLSNLARWAHSKEDSYQLFARALSLNAAYNAWRSGHPWEEELNTLIEQTRQEFAHDEDEYSMGELTLVWAEAQAFYHRQLRLGADETHAA